MLVNDNILWPVFQQLLYFCLSLGFPRQEYCSGLPFPSPGDPPDPGMNPSLLHWHVHLGVLRELQLSPAMPSSGENPTPEQGSHETKAGKVHETQMLSTTLA